MKRVCSFLLTLLLIITAIIPCETVFASADQKTIPVYYKAPDADYNYYKSFSDTITKGKDYYISNNRLTRSGYTFKGWRKGSVTYSPGSKFKLDYNDTASAITFNAVWEPNTYCIYFYANGGQNAPPTQVVKYNQYVQLSNTKPTRSGYKFLGWTMYYNSDQISYNAGSFFRWSSTSNLNLYAVWGKADTPSSGSDYSNYQNDYSYTDSSVTKNQTTVKPKAYESEAKIKKFKRKKGEIVVYWMPVYKVSGYQIQYSTSKSFKKNRTKKHTVKNGEYKSFHLNGLKRKKKYYIRIRAYKALNGVKYYGPWSKKKAVKTK